MANNKTKQYDPKLREDIASFKASMAFIIFSLIIFLTASNIQNNRETYRFRDYLDHNMWLMLIPVGIFAVSAVLKFLAISKKKDESYSYFSTSDFLGLAFLFLVYSLTFAATNNILMYSAVVIGFALAYYTKRFFNTDFYAVTLLNLAIAMGLWLKFGNKGWSTLLSKISLVILLAFAVITAVLVVAFVFAKLCSKDKGCKLTKALYIFGVRSKADSAKLSLVPVFISLVTGIVLALILMLAPQLITLLVAEIILLIQYVALGVYYTVKLINQ